MKIKNTIERIPGGMMLVPLILGAILNTFAQDTGAYFGSFTKGMISGTVPILAVWFFCIGASIDLRATGTVLRKSGTPGTDQNCRCLGYCGNDCRLLYSQAVFRPVCLQVCPFWPSFLRWT